MITVFIILIVVLIVGFVLIQNYNKNKESSEEKHERKASKILDLRYSDTYYHKDVTPWLNEMISDGVDSGIKNYEVLNHHFKITFNNWNYGSKVVKRENYSNTVTEKKKDGTEESFSVSGVKIEKNFYANYDLIAEAILTSDNTILYSEPLNLNYSRNDRYLIGKGSKKANKSGSKLVGSEPTPSINPKDAFTNSFQQQTMNLFSKWFN